MSECGIQISMSPLISPRENAHDTEKTYNSTPPASVQTAAKTEISESQAETGDDLLPHKLTLLCKDYEEATSALLAILRSATKNSVEKSEEDVDIIVRQGNVFLKDLERFASTLEYICDESSSQACNEISRSLSRKASILRETLRSTLEIVRSRKYRSLFPVASVNAELFLKPRALNEPTTIMIASRTQIEPLTHRETSESIDLPLPGIPIPSTPLNLPSSKDTYFKTSCNGRREGPNENLVARQSSQPRSFPANSPEIAFLSSFSSLAISKAGRNRDIHDDDDSPLRFDEANDIYSNKHYILSSAKSGESFGSYENGGELQDNLMSCTLRLDTLGKESLKKNDELGQVRIDIWDSDGGHRVQHAAGCRLKSMTANEPSHIATEMFSFVEGKKPSEAMEDYANIVRVSLDEGQKEPGGYNGLCCSPGATTCNVSKGGNYAGRTCAASARRDSNPRKRRGNEDSSEDAGDDDDGDRPPKRPTKLPASRSNIKCYVLCPYFLKNRQGPHASHTCKAPIETKQLKGHIQRIHLKAHQCKDCGARFGDNGQLNSHMDSGCKSKQFTKVPESVQQMHKDLIAARGASYETIYALLFDGKEPEAQYRVYMEDLEQAMEGSPSFRAAVYSPSSQGGSNGSDQSSLPAEYLNLENSERESLSEEIWYRMERDLAEIRQRFFLKFSKALEEAKEDMERKRNHHINLLKTELILQRRRPPLKATYKGETFTSSNALKAKEVFGSDNTLSESNAFESPAFDDKRYDYRNRGAEMADISISTTAPSTQLECIPTQAPSISRTPNVERRPNVLTESASSQLTYALATTRSTSEGRERESALTENWTHLPYLDTGFDHANPLSVSSLPCGGSFQDVSAMSMDAQESAPYPHGFESINDANGGSGGAFPDNRYDCWFGLTWDKDDDFEPQE